MKNSSLTYCVRCKAPTKYDKTFLCECGFRFYYGINRADIVFKNIGNELVAIEWNFNTNKSLIYVWSFKDNTYIPFFTLPINDIPFDITEGRVKTLLLFS